MWSSNHSFLSICFCRKGNESVVGHMLNIPITITVRNENQTAFEPLLKLSLSGDEIIMLPEFVETQDASPCPAMADTALEKCRLVKKLTKNKEVDKAKSHNLLHTLDVITHNNISRLISPTLCA